MSETPENIWVLVKGDFIHANWSNHPVDDEDIEYIRADKVEQQKEWVGVLEEFIKNGVELGYITIPDKEINDPAYYTLQQLGCVA